MAEKDMKHDYFMVITGGIEFDENNYRHRVLMYEINRLLENPENQEIVNISSLVHDIVDENDEKNTKDEKKKGKRQR